MREGRDAIVFEPGDEHCLSPLGKTGGLQPIRLEAQCDWQEVLHEILHSLGFVHEQSRTDRDQYVSILWDNIDESYRSQFAIVPQLWMDPIEGLPFDYQSIMIYDTRSFVKDPKIPNMRSKTDTKIGPLADGLSEGDIRKLNRMFRGHE
jgi:hypothetical protein